MNAAMIGGLGFHHYRADAGRGVGVDFDAFARLPEISTVKFVPNGEKGVAAS